MPVYLRITVDGQRTEFAVSRKCNPKHWDAVSGRATGTKADAKILNAYLDNLPFKIRELQRRMAESDETITAETLKNRFIGKAEKARTLLSIFEDHNVKMKSLV